jgi:hypothetical protein
LTENLPPIPPAPQNPPQAPGGYDQQAYPAPAQYAAPASYPGHQQAYGPPQGGYPQQGYPVPGPYAQPHAGYFQQPGQWAPAGPPKAKSSGYRVAAGIVEIVLGTWLLVPSIAGFQYGDGTAFMAFLVLVAALGNITSGIVLLANQRSRNQGPAVTSLSFAGLALLLGLIGLGVPYFGPALLVSAMILATPVLIVMGIGLTRERRGV